MVIKTEVLVTITSETGIVTIGGASCPRIRLTAEADQKTVHPVAKVDLFLENGAPIQNRIMAFEYRLAGAEEWIIDGVELTDADGQASHVMASNLDDALYDIRVTAGTVDNGLIGLTSNTVQVTTDKPDEKPILPPSYDKWIIGKADGKYGYIGYMIIGQGSPAGTEFGKIPTLNKPKPAVGWTMQANANFAVDPVTGAITLTNTSLAAGTYYVTLTCANSEGSAEITVPLTVTAAVSKVFYVDFDNGLDSNDGRTPLVPLKTIGAATGKRGSDIFSTYTIRLKRGALWDQANSFSPAKLTKFQCYGDPSKDPPHVRNMNDGGKVIHYTGSGQLEDVDIQDWLITGNYRGVDISNWLRGNLIRLKFGLNVQQGNAIYLHAARGISIMHCAIPDGIRGDGVYLRAFGRGATPNRVSFNYFGIPYGAGSDNLQITSERKAGMEPADVEVSDNVFRHSLTSNAQKGNCVIEGASRAVFERNDCEGNYFCLSSLSNFVTVRDNYLRGAALNDNSFGLGTGAIVHTRDQRWIFNRIEGCWYAFAISGYDDPEGLWQRLDYEILYNITRKNKGFFKHDRPATGYVTNNVSEQNGNSGFTGSQPVATGYTNSAGTFIAPDYPAFTKTDNHVNAAETTPPAAAPTISGTMTAGSTLTVDVPAIPGATAAVQWLVNDRKVDGETAATFVIPPGAAVNPYMPTNLNAPTVSCAVTYTMADGSTLIVPARYDDGCATRAIAA